MVRDYSPNNTLEWTAADREGLYEIEASVQDLNTGENSRTILPFEIVYQEKDGVPESNSTINPMVYLHSAQPS